jgi:hypothetical protein
MSGQVANPLNVHSLALFTSYYNFVRTHKSVRMTPAKAAGVCRRHWEIADTVALVEAAEARLAKRRPHHTRGA